MKRIILIFLLLPFITTAQISITKPIAGVASTTNASTYSMTAFTPTANSLLVVFVHATGTVTSPSTMTGGGLTWQYGSGNVNPNTNGNLYQIFYAQVGAIPSSTTITFDCTGDAATGCLMTVFQVTGHDVASPVVQTNRAAGTTTSTNANVTFASALNTNNGYFIAWTGGLTANVSIPPTGWTEGDDLAYSTPGTNMATAYRAGGESTTGPYTFTNASTTWYSMWIEIKVNTVTPHSRRITIIQ